MKKAHVYFWIATTSIFLFEGLMPLATLIFSPENIYAGTKPLGYPDYFAYALAVCKIFGATAIMIPTLPEKLKEWAYAGLFFNLLFATYSHIMVDGNIGYMIMPVIVAGVLTISYVTRTA